MKKGFARSGVFVGSVPPPIGGVSQFNYEFYEWLRDRYQIDWLEPKMTLGFMARTAVAALRREELFVASVSRLRSGVAIGALAAFWSSDFRILFLHGQVDLNRRVSPAIGAIARMFLRRFDAILVNREDIRDHLRQLGMPSELFSPMVPSISSSSARGGHRIHSTDAVHNQNSNRELKLITFVYNCEDVYNLSTILSVKKKLVPQKAASLTVVFYGSVLPQTIPDGIETAYFNIPEESVNDLLANSDVLLRITNWDGDSRVVRQALSHGLRVIATDTVARPQDVQLVQLDTDLITQAVLGKVARRMSDGRGLGPTADIALIRVLK